MVTTRDIATISYNTIENLTRVLDKLVKDDNISFYAFVYHYAEADEGKNHIHLFMSPSKKIDTLQLRKEFEELDPTNPQQKPLGVLPINPSKFGDWFLYSSHDTRYLASKGQSREYHYQLSDFVSSDCDYLLELTHTIDYSKLNRNQDIIKAIESGLSFGDMVQTGQVPVQLISQYERMYTLIYNNIISKVVTRDIDPETGEVIESHTPTENNDYDDDDDLPF